MPVTDAERAGAKKLYSAVGEILASAVLDPAELAKWTGDATDKLRAKGLTIDQGCTISVEGGGAGQSGEAVINVKLPPGSAPAAAFSGKITINVVP